LKSYPPIDSSSRRSQNPGPLRIDKVGKQPLKDSSAEPGLVRHVQKMLYELGYLLSSDSRFIDGVDGLYEHTSSAVRLFQSEHVDWEGVQLPATGEVDEKTADALNREMVGIWYPCYFSKDKDLNYAPPSPSLHLVTIDYDFLQQSNVNLPPDLFRVVLVAFGNPPKGPAKCVNFIPNDPEADNVTHWGNNSPVPRYLLKEVNLVHLRLDGQSPTWALRNRPGDSYTAVGPNYPEPGRFPSDNVYDNWPGDQGPDFAFEAGQVHVTIARTVRMWRMRGLDFRSWRRGQHSVANPLQVTLHDPNAWNTFSYYSRPRQVHLGYSATDNLACANCFEDVSHEVGHAILDSVAPSLWSTANRTVVSFHESFSDITAMLSTLCDPDVREALLDETGGNLRLSNLVSRFAEEIGDYVATLPNGSQYADIGCLREACKQNPAVNPFPPPQHFPFNYRSPGPPNQNPATHLAVAYQAGQDFSNTVLWRSDVPHDFSRVFTMAFYDSLVNAYDRLRHGSTDRDVQDEALREASGCLATIFSRAIMRDPNNKPNYFRVVALNMFRVDYDDFEAEFNGDLLGSGPGNGFLGKSIVSTGDMLSLAAELAKPKM